jgi:hypothetical protein
MLHLKTAAGERLEIPAVCIMAVMKPCNGINPAAIIYDVGTGPQADQLADQYGYVKKAVIDSQGMVNPLEVRIIEQVTIGTDADAVTGFHEGRMFIARDRIVGRREVLDDPHGVKARLFIRLFDRPNTINVADTLDEIDGIEPPTKPANRTAKPIPLQGA